jgi:hypothetical protein
VYHVRPFREDEPDQCHEREGRRAGGYYVQDR